MRVPPPSRMVSISTVKPCEFEVSTEAPSRRAASTRASSPVRMASKSEGEGEQGARLYIGSVCVLAPYRNRGIGGKLIAKCLAAAEAWGDENIKDAYLHVQTSNEEAVKFYEKYGFVKQRVIENYYKRIDPPHAVLMVRPFVYPPSTPSIQV